MQGIWQKGRRAYGTGHRLCDTGYFWQFLCHRLKHVTYHKLKHPESLTYVQIYDYTGHMDNSVRDIDELGEIVVVEYAKSYDLDIAMMKAEVSAEEKELLTKSEDFMYQIAYTDALVREEIIETMVTNVRIGNPSTRQKAAVDLGNILYKSKFSKKDEEIKTVVPDKIVMVGAE